MEHAIILMAHCNPYQLIPLSKYFSSDCMVFIHIDSKDNISPYIYKKLSSIPWVQLISKRFDIHWGGFSMLEAELYLLRFAYENGRYDFYHLISGQDYPIKPLSTFLHFFEQKKGYSFIEHKHYSIENERNPIYSRGKYFLPYDRTNGRSIAGANKIRKWVLQQKSCGFLRKNRCVFKNYYKGSQWFSMTHKTLHLLLDYTEKFPTYYQSLKFTFAPEEIYIPTIVANIANEPIINNNLRYIRWYGENGSNPSNLGVENYQSIMNSDAFFARKMQSPYSDALIDLINKNLIAE